jgi:two-component system cell cycle sensor histidine kinase/response regulator CckA
MPFDPRKPGIPTSPELMKTQELGGARQAADLMALTGDLAGRRYTVERQVLIGRDPEAKIQVPGEDVSRRHASIWQTEGGEFVIEDLKSRNGTLVNGIPIEVHVLTFGDKIQVGSRTLFVFTRHQALEEQLVQWQRIELIAQMTAGLVHDFNNYMAALLGYVQYLGEFARRDLSKEALLKLLNDCLPVMESAALEGSNLARKVLTFARGSKRPEVAVDLAALVEEAVSLIKRNLGRSIEVELTLEHPLRVVGERTELLQVLINLFLNARDAMPEGGSLRVQGAVCHVDGEQALALQANEQVVVKVRDTGAGMDAETQKRIFEPLFTTKDPGKGTGLGLSMVSRIIEAHGGMIRVESEPNKGTEFTIYLPVAEAKHTPLKVNTTLVMSHLQPPVDGQVRGSGLVLLLEADDLMRQRAARVLCALGYEVLFATGADEAAELYERYHERIKLVVLNLDQQEGAEQLRARIEAVDPAAKMILTSADVALAPPPGVDQVVRVPCDTRSFQQIIVAALEDPED